MNYKTSTTNNHRQQLELTIDYLKNLISFNTESAKSNLAIVQYIKSILNQYQEISFFEVTNQDNTKANLFATLPATDGSTEGGIVLSGHLDVVPVTGQAWDTDPFIMVQKDDKLYGRGTCDMKGFIAICLAIIPQLISSKRNQPIYFSFSYDEEVGCLGAKVLVEYLKQHDIQPTIAIIGEPTTMQVIEGHKSCNEYTTNFYGLAGHSSLPDLGVNAIEYAVRYVTQLLEIKEELHKSAPNNSRFEPPHSTLQIGGMTGGIAHNVIADTCQVNWEVRAIQTTDLEYVHSTIDTYTKNLLLPAMQRIFPNATISKQIVGEVEGLKIMPESKAKDLTLALTNNKTTGLVSFGTEAGLFQTLGTSAVVCGPGSIKQAHKANEYISIEQIELCLQFFNKLNKSLAN